MKRKKKMKIILCGALWFFLFPLALSLLPLRSETDRPNILFIAVDDMNDWIGPL
jgi:hypothetical protein